jgi:hypothetical protein
LFLQWRGRVPAKWVAVSGKKALQTKCFARVRRNSGAHFCEVRARPWSKTRVTNWIDSGRGNARRCTAHSKTSSPRRRALRIGGLALLFAFASQFGHARDDGRYANSPLKLWFDSLKSGKGPCCSDADGYAVADPDWESKSGHYRVRIEGEWWDVPDDAVITEPNRAGRTMVWPIRGWGGLTIRCFLPGSMT